LTAFVVATIGVDYVRATRARLRAGAPLFAAMGGLLVRHNRRYGGFVIHLGILVIVVGITGSQAWSLQREATLRRGEAVEVAGYRFQFEGLAAREAGTHFLVESTFKVTNGRAAVDELRPAKKFYRQEQSPIAHVDYRLGFIDDLYLVLGDFARDGSEATVKVQVNRMVSWIWFGGLILTLGTALAVLPERKQKP
jgi:cytochrome c-type biogenesis protein CcmF